MTDAERLAECRALAHAFVAATPVEYTRTLKWLLDHLTASEVARQQVEQERDDARLVIRARFAVVEACGEDHIIGTKPDECFSCLSDKAEAAEQRAVKAETDIRWVRAQRDADCERWQKAEERAEAAEQQVTALRSELEQAVKGWKARELNAVLETEPQWQPIETAPKDGTPILIAIKTRIDVARWRTEDYGWEGPDTCLFSEDPTHWMPLPDPPVSQDTSLQPSNLADQWLADAKLLLRHDADPGAILKTFTEHALNHAADVTPVQLDSFLITLEVVVGLYDVARSERLKKGWTP